MIRGLALTASLLLAGAVPAFGQTHHSGAQTHPRHAPGHVRPDSATHAAMHAQMTGSWKGTLSSAHGTSSALEMAIAHDSTRGMILRIGTAPTTPAAKVSALAIDGTRLQWTQDLSGASCKATAVLTAATAVDRETITGKMACADGERSFVLRKTTG